MGRACTPRSRAAALAGSSDPDKIWKPFDEVSASRRTIYAFVKRSLIVPMLEVLDFCDTARSTARRNVTSVPTQALTLLNGDFVNRQARHLADRLERDAGPDPAAQIERAYPADPLPDASRGRSARPCSAFLDQESRGRLAEAAQAGSPLTTAQARHEALVQLCRAIFNMNEFVYPRLMLAGASTDDESPTPVLQSRFIPNPTPCGRSRREFLWEVGGGFAGLALIDLLSRSGFFSTSAQAAEPAGESRIGRGDPAVSAVAQAAPLPGPGQARGLPVHERRSQSGRHVRPQAGAREVPRIGLSRERRRSAPTAAPSAT